MYWWVIRPTEPSPYVMRPRIFGVRHLDALGWNFLGEFSAPTKLAETCETFEKIHIEVDKFRS